jgi:adenylosuccinate lyase
VSVAEKWTDQARMDAWLLVERAVLLASIQEGVVPSSAYVASAAAFTVGEVEEREKATGHDVAAFVDVIQESVGAVGRWLHYGLTSSDVVDTGLALQLKASARALGATGPLREAFNQAAVGKLSGSMGTYPVLPPAVEKRALLRLGVRSEPAATQVVARDRLAHLLTEVALVGRTPLLRGYANAALEDIVLWHERDISHSSVERIILPAALVELEQVQS